MRRVLIATGLIALGSCGEQSSGRPPTGLETLGLSAVEPSVVLPGSRIEIQGSSFLGEPLGISWLRLSGNYAGRAVNVELPATFDDFDRMHIDVDASTLRILGSDTGMFSGQGNVVVDFVPDGTRHQSQALSLSIDFRQTLDPVLDKVLSQGAIYVNSPIPVEGSGFLLGEGEGVTYAVVEGCFVPLGADECGANTLTRIPVEPETAYDRTRGAFAFSPHIAGIAGGRFEGRVHLENVLADGSTASSEDQAVAYDLLQTTVTRMGESGSLGQFIDMEGGGFIGGEDGITLMEIEGEFFADDGVGGVPVPPLPIIPEFVDGGLVRYVVNEQDSLGTALVDQGGVRYAAGTFDGTIRPIAQFGGQEVVGPQTPIAFKIAPVKQVVWIKFNASYVESLRTFGLRALDQRIRDRVFEVLQRDYATINVEFRAEEPEDFSQYAIVEIAGPDPNGLGLLGYDNTPGKDVNNQRLFDRIGGVNAVTQEDGYAGYGGVFIESLFTFSNHPPSGISAEVGNDIFDDIFDEFRPDRGTPVNSEDEAGAGIPVLTSGGGCPTNDRKLQAACAVWTLGSLIGTTTSHELGHSLGLADPGSSSRFHNLGDGDNRLMDSGGVRPFEERAELMGQGPSVFCDSAYRYLRNILPTDDLPNDIERPFC